MIKTSRLHDRCEAPCLVCVITMQVYCKDNVVVIRLPDG